MYGLLTACISFSSCCVLGLLAACINLVAALYLVFYQHVLVSVAAGC